MRELQAPLLSERTSIRLGGRALAELVPENLDDVLACHDHVARLGGKPFLLGAGSNVIAGDGDLPIVLIRPDFWQEIDFAGRISDKVLVRAGAGVPLPKLLNFCLKHELGGLEGLVGIPGTVGGAVAMNAGSFGTEIFEKILSIKVLNDGRISEVPASAIKSAYRELEIPQKKMDFMVLEAIFGLTEDKRDGISIRMRHNFFEKKSRQPVTALSAGCVFKNPSTGFTAGKLLDSCGFKGRSLGGMQFSPLHANFLINTGNGTASDAFDLMAEARESVLRKFGVVLEPEVRILQ